MIKKIDDISVLMSLFKNISYHLSKNFSINRFYNENKNNQY